MQTFAKNLGERGFEPKNAAATPKIANRLIFTAS
jgi:hypothetical protein